MSATETPAKTLTAMTQEVMEWCHSKGWYDKPVSFREAMALLHTEVAEASDAWRRWGTQDATDPTVEPNLICKPEGVGSEFADVLIRLLDDCGRFGVDLEAEVGYHAGLYGISESFLENMNALHSMIARASFAWEDAHWQFGREFAAITVFLRQCCAEYGIDLTVEYERKMTYNRTRPYRHGKRQ